VFRLVSKRQFGVSTGLFRTQRLSRDHLLAIAAHGFETTELLATAGHVDVSNPAATADLQQWLAEAGLELATVHVPAKPTSAVQGSRSGAVRSESASKDGSRALDEEIEQALFIARRIPVKVFVMHLEGTRDAARRRVERMVALAGPLGVTVAIDASDLSRPGSAVHFVEDETEDPVGICLDFAQAHQDGDLVDALEVVAEHLSAARLPIDSGIDWAPALTTVQKIGYDGPLIFNGEARGSAKEILGRAKATREKMERWLTSI
jgi:sugar phosphate isomerase/epimerase